MELETPLPAVPTAQELAAGADEVENDDRERARQLVSERPRVQDPELQWLRVAACHATSSESGRSTRLK